MYLDGEKKVLGDLERQYKRALEAIDEKIAALLGRGDADMQHVIYRVEHQKALRIQVQAILEQLQANEFETISEYLTNSYNDGFVAAMYSMHQQDQPFVVPIDQKQVVQAIQHDTKLSEDLYTSLGEDVQRLKKVISAEISRGIASGLGYGEIARNIGNLSKAPLSRAKTIARTEAGRIQEQATIDAAAKSKAKGARIVKMWDAVRDGSTRSAHRQLHGQVREIEEPYEYGTKKAMHPHGFGDPALDINCRCTSVIMSKKLLDKTMLEELQENAKAWGLDTTDSIEEFKKRYMKAAETVEKSGKSGIMDTGKTASGSSKSAADNVEFSGGSDRLYEIKLSRERKKAIIERGISEERPIFAVDTEKNKFASYVKSVKAKEGWYDVALHGRDTSVEFFGTNIDAYTLAQIIRQRKDYKPGMTVRLLSCDTGKTDNTGDCVAQIVANELGVIVEAPTDILYVARDGTFTIGDRNEGKMATFYPRK